MGLTKIGEKLDKYFGRLDDGKAVKIKPAHVEKVIAKLRAKQSILQQEIDTATKPSQKERLKRKLSVAEDQIERAEWLMEKIGRPEGA
ncbi:MAG: hypothetical protein WBV78_20960 [Roseobacter sp.]